MKTRNIFKVILTALTAAVFFSCDIPVSLGTKLDLDGPIVTITAPFQRQSVPVHFDMEGTVKDLSGVERMEIKAVRNNKDYARRWRYFKDAWEVSDNYGASWSPYADAQWNGTKQSASWKIHINMEITGQIAEEGEYTFNIQAWDRGDFSDDNSFKALVIIIDRDPPKVDISYPFLYRGERPYEDDPTFKDLHETSDDSDKRRDPSYLGKFIVQGFDLKWQIDDFSEIWSIDIRFYKYDTPIDNNPETALPGGYIYKYSKNTPPPPPNINPADFAGLKGSVGIPDLTKEAGIYDQGGILENPISEITTVKVVAVCYDAAGNPNQEKTLGFFVYWPRAVTPWIIFAEGLENPEDLYGSPTGPFTSQNPNTIEPNVFKVYPSKMIKSTAYQAHGVKEVRYTLYKCEMTVEGDLTILHSQGAVERAETVLLNPPSRGGTYSTIFSWDFEVPPFTGYYVVEAQAFSTQNLPSDDYKMLFMVNDITFPDFPEPPNPVASNPLFLAINNNKIKIEGIVSDASEVKTLALVWINPRSKNFAAMSQLAYFRDKDYIGWKRAITSSNKGVPITEISSEAFDPSQPNILWNLNIVEAGRDPDTERNLFRYSQEIDLADLKIGVGQSPLSSQMFLLRAENPGMKCTIITYAPKGDTVAPAIATSKVTIKRASAADVVLEPNKFIVLPQFANNDTITIEGTWREDSMETLPMATYFTPNFIIEINNNKMGAPVLTQNSDKVTGTWTLQATVKENGPFAAGQVPLSRLKDTLTIDVQTKDIGGNVSDIGNSWLVATDHLQLMRISSEKEDGIYRAGETVEIFLEFNKPVKLAYNLDDSVSETSELRPQLLLNTVTSTGAAATARAYYKKGQANNSRHYFVYTVAANQNASPLNVTGLRHNGTDFTASTAYNTANYPFAWSRGEGSDAEEVRATMQTGKTGAEEPGSNPKYRVRTLPTSSVTTSSDYQFSLAGGKDIKIDTTAPRPLSVTANSAQGWYSAGDIYFTINFDEPVMFSSASVPAFPLRINSNSTGFTSSNAADVRVNGNSITFMYTIRTSDTSNGAEVYISSSQNHTGTITDLAGNPLATGTGAGTVRALSESARTLAGVYIQAVRPNPPTVRLLRSNTTANTGNALSQNVNGNNETGESGNAVVNLSNIYDEDLWLAIAGAGSAHNYAAIEYSVDGGTNYVRANNTANTPFQLTATGNYRITARQIDRAGNVSNATNAVNFNWDKGALLTRISSESANGEYTHTSGRNEIKLTLFFRKPLRISGSPQITLNALRSSNPINVTTWAAASDNLSLTFTYTVQNGDSTPTGADLAITAVSGITAWDGTSTGNGVDVSNIISSNFTALPTPKLDSNKKFTVITGNLTLGTPSFIEDNAGGTGWNTESNANFHGIRSDDGSYWTTLEVPYNRNIFKGSGNITITQNASNYRLPAVLTEAQFNRFRNVANFNTYYIRGTNGYNDNKKVSDTATKYILKYNYNPDSAVTSNNSGFTGDTAVPSAFFTDFRSAEEININVNSQAVKVVGSKLVIRLAGSSAPQVPGASYRVSLPAGLVSDSLGNTSATDSKDITLRGVAKPFVRIRKTQDKIETDTGSITQPRLKATQPMQSYARMDNRTPLAVITYAANEYKNHDNNNVTQRNWGTGVNRTNNGDNQNAWGVPNAINTAVVNGVSWIALDGPNDKSNSAPRPTDVAANAAYATAYTTSSQITLGNTELQGYQWWVRAKANVGSVYSAETEEKAYRTVITYLIRNNLYSNQEITGNANESIMESGDQIWIRGGDAIGSSSIPGFPFTWEDNWNGGTDYWKDRRAGIRLMSKTNTTDNLNNSVWKFVTWEINTTAYIDFIRGRDTESTADEAWQYGPRQLAYQRSGWTALKDKYPIYPGQHRWCDIGNDWAGKWAMNFSATFHNRPTNLSVDYSGVNQE